MPKHDWDIPAKLQPDPKDWGFDLDHALSAVVRIRSVVPNDAFTAGALGTDRTGSGVVIRPDGLVLTVGYLILEAEQIWLSCADGRVLAATPLAYDAETGFGLVQPLGRLGLPHLKMGDSTALGLGAPVIFASAGGRRHAVSTKLVGRQEFAGYWEYLLDEALFTAPAHPFWGGAALIGPDGDLLGIGSLILQQGDGKGQRVDMNMVVPVDLLRPVLHEMLTTGRSGRPARPWLGLYVTEGEDTIIVEGTADNGPAEQAGLQGGDRILTVQGDAVGDLAGLWRKIWSSGNAGAEVRLQVQRDSRTITVPVVSADRQTFLKSPRLH